MSRDMIDRMMKAVNWMEEHLHDDRYPNGPAAAACFSEYHFHRLFKSVTGLSPGLYMRRRRLTIAAESLRLKGHDLLQIAMDAGYESQEAFTRAFKDFFGVTPGALRQEECEPSMAFQPPLSRENLLHFTDGGLTPEPEFRSFPACRLAGYRAVFDVGQYHETDRLWGEFLNRLEQLGFRPDVTYGVCHGSMIGAMPSRRMTYMAGFEIENSEIVPEDMTEINLPGGTYAVFTHTGSLAELETTVRYIWQCWLPRSGYGLADAPDFERYGEDFDQGKLEGTMEIWIPLRTEGV